MTEGYDTNVQWYQGLETYRMPLEGGLSYVYIQEPKNGDGKAQILELHKRYYKDHQDLKDANLTLNIIYEKLGLDGDFNAEICLQAIYELRALKALLAENKRYREALENIASVSLIELLDRPDYWGNMINTEANQALNPSAEVKTNDK